MAQRLQHYSLRARESTQREFQEVTQRIGISVNQDLNETLEIYIKVNSRSDENPDPIRPGALQRKLLGEEYDRNKGKSHAGAVALPQR